MVPWLVQPKYPPSVNPDWSRGLLTLLLPDGRNIPRNVVSGGAQISTTEGAPAAAVGPAGRAVNSPGTTTNWVVPGIDSTCLAGASILIVYNKTDTTNRGSSIFGAPATGTNIFNAHAPFSDGVTYWDFGGNTGANRISVGGLSYSKPTCLVFSAGANGSRIVQDGVVRASQASPISRTVSSANWSLNRGGLAGDLVNIYAAAIWSREMLGGEAVQLSRNPWQLFAPQTRRIWVPGAVGGAYTVTADAGAYTLAGQDAALIKTRILTADAGAYALSGQAASVLVGRLVTGDAGAYSLAGQDATLLRARVVSADSGAYALSGQDAALTYVPAGSTYTLTCDAGAYAMSGQAASLLLGRVVSADAGAYSINGQDATISWSGASTTVEAGKRKRKPILIEVQGRIQEFETQAAADAYLASIEPAQEKRFEAKARRIARAVISSGNAFVPPVFAPVQVIRGPEEFKAAVNMRAALMQAKLNESVRVQIAREMQDRDDEDHAVAVMLLM